MPKTAQTSLLMGNSRIQTRKFPKTTAGAKPKSAKNNSYNHPNEVLNFINFKTQRQTKQTLNP